MRNEEDKVRKGPLSCWIMAIVRTLNKSIDGVSDAREFDDLVGESGIDDGAWHAVDGAAVGMLCEDVSAAGLNKLAAGSAIASHTGEYDGKQVAAIDIHSRPECVIGGWAAILFWWGVGQCESDLFGVASFQQQMLASAGDERVTGFFDKAVFRFEDVKFAGIVESRGERGGMC